MANNTQKFPLGRRPAFNYTIILILTLALADWAAADDDNDNPYYVAPTIPANGSQSWLVNGKVGPSIIII
jgi:hypothetical protein